MGKLGRPMNFRGFQHKQPLPETRLQDQNRLFIPHHNNKRKLNGETNSHRVCGVSLTEASSYCFSNKSQFTRTILGNKNKAYYPLTLHHQVVQRFVVWFGLLFFGWLVVFFPLWYWILFFCPPEISHFHQEINLTLGGGGNQVKKWIYRLLLRCNKQTVHLQNNNY